MHQEYLESRSTNLVLGILGECSPFRGDFEGKGSSQGYLDFHRQGIHPSSTLPFICTWKRTKSLHIRHLKFKSIFPSFQRKSSNTFLQSIFGFPQIGQFIIQRSLILRISSLGYVIVQQEFLTFFKKVKSKQKKNNEPGAKSLIYKK